MERTICCCCGAHIPTVVGESIMPLCKKCKETHLSKDRVLTEPFLQAELQKLRRLSSTSSLFSAWLLYDNQILQQILSDDDERNGEISELQREENLVTGQIGRPFLPYLYRQLGIYFVRSGYEEEGTTLLMNAIGSFNANVLLYGDPPEEVVPALSATYMELAKIYKNQKKDTLYAWATGNADKLRENGF